MQAARVRLPDGVYKEFEVNVSCLDGHLPWEFFFEVKFHPTTPTTIVDDHARYYVFLQLRRDILTGRLPATVDTHALLGSFVAQMEFGDAPAQVNDEYEKFIVGARLVPTEHSNAEVSRTERTDGFGGGDLFLDQCKYLPLMVFTFSRQL
uniref:FERM domain-containing protein n=1 Tax=Caenorhabditis japonica TaxID=281687 RepID=A0A8R1DXZ4_CAEJA